MRFELMVRFRTPDPQSGAFDPSATSPFIYYNILPLFASVELLWVYGYLSPLH